jgi:hypothetical protein
VASIGFRDDYDAITLSRTQNSDAVRVLVTKVYVMIFGIQDREGAGCNNLPTSLPSASRLGSLAEGPDPQVGQIRARLSEPASTPSSDLPFAT